MTTLELGIEQSHTRSEIRNEIVLDTRGMLKSDWWFLNQKPSTEKENHTRHSSDVAPSTRSVLSIGRPRPVSKENGEFRRNAVQKTLLQQWECVVLWKDVEVVGCELHDLTDENAAAEYAEVYACQFNTYDLPLLIEGAVFYWSLGYKRMKNGQIMNSSEFIVRRTPNLTRRQKTRIQEKVSKVCELFNRQ